ncbi:MAG: alpha-L-rhamnosidase [Anaerolineae bacterium]|nr:alpha-L-rhamnosidase [Anaerolineae bacterium]
MKILLDHNPLAPNNAAPTDFSVAYRARPAWITPRHSQLPPEVTAYRLRLALPQATMLRVHVSADERYVLYMDGQRVGRGPERGSDRAWFYETYDLDLATGTHTLAALVWRLGEVGPRAQISLAGGFLLEAEGPYSELVSTKSAAWETKPVHGIDFSIPSGAREIAWFVEPIQTTDSAAYPWGFEMGQGENWEPATARREDFAFPFGIQPVHTLQPALLPAQMSAPRCAGRVRYVSATAWSDPQSIVVDAEANLSSEAVTWQSLLDESIPLVIPAHTHRQVVLDLEQYVCAYPQVRLSGGSGSQITIGWAEALHMDGSGKTKGQRDEVAGRTFIAICRDVILPDGSARRQFEPLWWRAGRFVELLIETGDQPLTIESFGLLETRYPLEMESYFSSSDPRLDAVTPVALRGLQMCAHETYMDCPYYEQMMYVGDTRLEALTTYAISTDDRLPRKAIILFELSRLSHGLTQARYPSRDVQVIPPFALWWIGMVYDYALWRGDRAFIAGMLPGVRSVLDGFLAHVRPENLLQAPNGWNFTDWIADWPLGVPPDGFNGFSGLLNWHLVYTLKLAARLEEWAGERLSAQRWQSWQDALAAATRDVFWDEQRGLFADDRAHARFSEHTQCLALLSGALEGEQYARTAQNLLSDASLTRTTIYFNHYLFETYRLLEQPAAFFKRMGLWFDLPEQGFKTTPEQPEPSRSDCHGWGAHPLYHFFATLLGIRPTSLGFNQVEIAPMPGHLKSLSGEMVHPRGRIEVDLHFENERVSGNVSLPAGLSGTFCYSKKTLTLRAGPQSIEL